MTEDRRRMIELFARLGVSADAVPESLEEASTFASDFVLRRDRPLDLAGVAREAGLSTDEARVRFERLGIRREHLDGRTFNERDAEVLAYIVGAHDFMLDEEVIAVARVIGQSLATLAQAVVSEYVRGPESRATDLIDNARSNIETTEIALMLGGHLDPLFAHHLRQAITDTRRVQHESSRAFVVMTVGFLDLVGFTKMSSGATADELVALVRDFQNQSHRIATDTGARVVKLIGDEVMFAAPSPSQAFAFVRAMMPPQRASAARAGLASGNLLNIHGDYFGEIVNLAARLVGLAQAGEMLVDSTVGAALGAEALGRRNVKGFDASVDVYRVQMDREPS